jgi:hypothetical protein
METTGQRPSLELALKVLKRGTRLVYHEELEETQHERRSQHVPETTFLLRF